MIGIIDYGAGNLGSVLKAVTNLGYEAKVIKTPQEIDEVDAYILPGVGAFCQAMENIKPLIPALNKNVLEKKKYILGICLGLQMLFDKSYEDGEYEGLGYIKGEVKKLDVEYKIPHMGWNEIIENEKDEITKDVEGFVYFVHSYYVDPEDFSLVKLYSEYGRKVPALVRSGNIVGMQFHPEKSAKTGMQLLKNFLEMVK